MGWMVATTPKTRATKEGKIRGKAQREKGRCGHKALRLFAGVFVALAVYQWSFHNRNLHAEFRRIGKENKLELPDRLYLCLPTPAQETKKTI